MTRKNNCCKSSDAVCLMIESAQNDTYKKLLSLTTAKGLKAHGLFLLPGEKLVREFLRAPCLPVVYEIMPPGGAPVASSAAPIYLSRALFDDIDVLGTHFNILVLEQPPMPILSDEDMKNYAPAGIELAIPVGDPANLGALIRSCEAFAVPRVILTREAAHPFLPKSVKASAGSVLRVPMARGPALGDFPDTAIALDIAGTPIDDFVWPANGMLLIGEEGQGFGCRQFGKRVTIPTKGVESLNVVVAASIALSRIR
ncbi:MAG: RNA methyltransferase [Alphaproteobacteria bacterium]|nr:RNA methyltransferase [Alphaproteobacteria bacterium]